MVYKGEFNKNENACSITSSSNLKWRKTTFIQFFNLLQIILRSSWAVSMYRPVDLVKEQNNGFPIIFCNQTPSNFLDIRLSPFTENSEPLHTGY